MRILAILACLSLTLCAPSWAQGSAGGYVNGMNKKKIGPMQSSVAWWDGTGILMYVFPFPLTRTQIRDLRDAPTAGFNQIIVPVRKPGAAQQREAAAISVSFDTSQGRPRVTNYRITVKGLNGELSHGGGTPVGGSSVTGDFATKKNGLIELRLTDPFGSDFQIQASCPAWWRDKRKVDPRS